MQALRSPLCWMSLLFALLCLWLLPFTLQHGDLIGSDGVPNGDSMQYDALARSLLEGRGYVFYGDRPFTEREPGYSIFLAGAYLLGGQGAYGFTMVLQAMLHLCSVLLFVCAWRASIPRGALSVFAGFMLFLPSVLHAIFSLTRESLTLSLLLCFFACIGFAQTARRWILPSVFAGAALGYAMLTYAPLLFLPVFLVAALPMAKIRPRVVLLSLCIAVAMLVPWGVRNMHVAGKPCLTGCYRQALQWHVRGEQAENIHGISMPLRCLYAEYVSRDWSDVSPYCNFNAVWHRQWPNGFVGVPEDAQITRLGQQKILANFPSYILFSLFEVVELHLPYVNGWGRTYNILAAAGTVLLYIGLLFGVLRRQAPLAILCLTCIVYVTGVFALTDAIPRYRIPVVFAYALLAGIGYHGAVQWLSSLWRRT